LNPSLFRGHLSTRQRGSALIAVLLALALLFSLGVPFVMSSRLRSESSRQSFDREQAQIAAESAADYSMLIQGDTHPSVDPTPLWDASFEWDASHAEPLPAAIGERWADLNQSWGLEVESLQSRISLASASPLLLQNVLHPCFLSSDATHDSPSLRVNSTAGFPEEGLLFVNGEWVQYGGLSPLAFLDVVPAEDPPEDTSQTRFRAGTALLDPRVWYLALSRFQEGQFEVPEFFDDAFAFNFDDDSTVLFSEQERHWLTQHTWMSTGSFGSPRWMPPEWMVRLISEENPDILFVNDASAFGPGTVVRLIPEEGEPFDSIVLAVESNRGILRLATPVPLDFIPWRTRVYPMRREPVDLNGARPEVLTALAAGVRFRNAPTTAMEVATPATFASPASSGQGSMSRPPSGSATTDWVSPSEANQFAQRVIDARPIQGPDDLWDRVLNPMAQAGELTEFEAWALWLNGMDPAHGLLAQSTTGFAYRSGERYLTRVEAAMRSRLGKTLSRYRRVLQTFAAPAGLLLQMWQSQESFEDLARWSRGMHRVVSFPANIGTLQPSDSTDFPSALTLRLGTSTQIGRTTPEADFELSSIRPATVRDNPIAGAGVSGVTEHFDFEPHPYGRDMSTSGPLRTTVSDWSLDFENGYSNNEPVHLQGWFQFPAGQADATLIDLSGLDVDRQRLSVTLQDGKLKTRLFDNAGDDPFDEDSLTQAVEWSLDLAEYPLADRWVHLSALMRAAHPRGVQMAVDGIPRGKSNCLTWLTSSPDAWAPGDGDGILAVESTEGFPERGVLKIGDEVLEYSSKTPTSFNLTRVETADGYIGGRAAREVSDTATAMVNTSHPSGAGVELYGYSALLESDIPPGLGRLDGSMGTWSVAVAADGTDAIDLMLIDGNTYPLGTGILGDTVGELTLAEMEVGDSTFLEAFQSNGGYALMFQGWVRGGDGHLWHDTMGFQVGGYEIVQYSERTETGIVLSRRNVRTPGTSGDQIPDYAYPEEGNSFITEWNPNFVDMGTGQPLNESPRWRVFVMPISVKGTGVLDVSYNNPSEEYSEFVQITSPIDAGLTEWVRYDSIFEGTFLRDNWGAIQRAVGYFLFELRQDIPADVDDPLNSTTQSQGSSSSSTWDVFTRTLGMQEPNRNLVIEEVRRQFDFRGVLGTFDHSHEGRLDLVPVFQTYRGTGYPTTSTNNDTTTGYVGRLDRVAVMQPATVGGSGLAPDWFTVQWGVSPNPSQVDGRVQLGRTYIAFSQHPAQPYLASDVSAMDPMASDFDVRNYARLSKFPSGERPSGLDTLVIGQDAASTSPTFAGMVDEFTAHTVGGMGAPTATFARGSFVLEEEMAEGGDQFIALSASKFMLDGHLIWVQVSGMLAELLPPSGIVDIDGERIGFTEVVVNNTEIRLMIAPSGRGMHGTQPRSHAAMAMVWAVDGRAASALSNDLEAQDSEFALDSSEGFSEYGAFLIGDELLHAPMRSESGDLLMPRLRPAPGSEDTYGSGALRGRFGTTPVIHAAGEIAYAWPTRFADLYTPQCDSPASAYFEFGLEDPNAHWRSLLYESQILDASQRVVLLARVGETDWEADPYLTPGLRLFDQGHLPGGDPMPLRFTGDRAEFRVMFDWGSGAFDPIEFRSTGWTSAPILRNVLMDSLAEPRVENFQEVHP